MDVLTGQMLVKKSRSAVNQCFIYLVINTFIIPKNAGYEENRICLQSLANPSIRGWCSHEALLQNMDVMRSAPIPNVWV